MEPQLPASTPTRVGSRARCAGWIAAFSLVCIGAAKLPAQPGTPGEPRSAIQVPVRDAELLDAFRSSFEPSRPQLWPRGFALAHELGATVAPLLERAANDEADARRRPLLLAAWSVAAGAAAQPGIVARLRDAARPDAGDAREQLVLLVALAMGPPPAPELREQLQDYATRVREPLLATAACLVLARFDRVGSVPLRWRRGRDGAALQCASNYLAGGSWKASLVRGVLRGEADVGQRTLLRGVWLGSKPGPPDAERASALQLGLRTRALHRRGVQIAAALQLVDCEDPAGWLQLLDEPFDADVIALLVADPRFRELLHERGELQLPPDWIGPVARRRVALAYALEVDRNVLRAERELWQRDADVAEVICLGVAWRLLGQPEAADPAWLEAVPDVRERLWVRFACGLPAPAGAVATFDDAALDRAWLVAARGGRNRLPAPAARRALEAALWRRDAHFGLLRRQAEADLLRDLLLAGSEYGAARLSVRDPELAELLPRGLDPGSFGFEIALELWRFLRPPGPGAGPTVPLR